MSIEQMLSSMQKMAIISAFYWWGRKKSLAIYSLLFVALPLAGGNFAGFSRYTLMAFPLQWMLAKNLKTRSSVIPWFSF